MSQHLDKMEVGQTMLFKGPKGRYTYEKGSLDAIGDPLNTQLDSAQTAGCHAGHNLHHAVCHSTRLTKYALWPTGMLAGGTGVTPMYQVANAILKNSADKTKITLLFANVSADDILIEEELTNLQALSPQFQVYICTCAPFLPAMMTLLYLQICKRWLCCMLLCIQTTHSLLSSSFTQTCLGIL